MRVKRVVDDECVTEVAFLGAGARRRSTPKKAAGRRSRGFAVASLP